MSSKQIVFLLLLAVFIFISVKWVRHKRLYEKYAVLWLAIAAISLISALYPSVVSAVGKIAHIALPSNLVFIVGIVVLLVLTFQLSFDISKSRKQIEILASEIALLKNKVNDLDE